MQAVELLRAVASVDPREYEAQMTRTAAAVRTVGTFIAELAERCGPSLTTVDFVLPRANPRTVLWAPTGTVDSSTYRCHLLALARWLGTPTAVCPAAAEVHRTVHHQDGCLRAPDGAVHCRPHQRSCVEARRVSLHRVPLRRVPRTVAAHVALLVPHLGCDAYPVRSGIVTAIGHLLARRLRAGRPRRRGQPGCGPDVRIGEKVPFLDGNGPSVLQEHRQLLVASYIWRS